MSEQSDAQAMPRVTIKGVEYERLRYGTEYLGRVGEKCHDCGVERGQVHVPGCDMEKCPKCDGLEGPLQAISCGCRWEGYDPEEEENDDE